MDFLLIAASFFGYSFEIKTRLEAQGRSVLWFEDRPAIDTKTKAILRLAPNLIRRQCDSYFDNIISEAKKFDIRDVLVIKGEALNPEIIGKMRKELPHARFILYFWDSYRNMPVDAPLKVALFDKTFSFDPVDVRQDNRLAYRPLFYLNEYAQLPSGSQDIDILFIGTSHTDRYAVLSKLASRLPTGVRFERILFMPSTQMYYIRKIVSPSYWQARRDEFVFTPLKKGEVMSLIARSRAVVDIERPIQTGFTMRTIEMLGASRKLLTTNPRIVDADFYNSKNQIFIDRVNPIVPIDFVNSSWETTPEDMLIKYSLDGWLDEVIGK